MMLLPQVGYRLNSWRHSIGAQCLKAISELLESYEPDSDKEIDEMENEDEDNEPEDDGERQFSVYCAATHICHY